MALTSKNKFNLAVAGVFAAVIGGGIYAQTNTDLMTDVDGTTAYVTNNLGLKSVTAGGYSAFGCHRGDFFSTKFSAQNAEGKTVTGTVCKTPFGRQTHSFD